MFKENESIPESVTAVGGQTDCCFKNTGEQVSAIQIKDSKLRAF
jgi:hypothetical protein